MSKQWTNAALFVAWYALSGIADRVNSNVARQAGVAVPCLLTFAQCYVFTVLVRLVGSEGAGDSERKRERSAIRANRGSCMASGVCIAFGLYFLLWAIQVKDMAHAYALKASEPLYVVVLATVAHETVTRQQAASVFVLCLGSSLLAFDQPAAAGPGRETRFSAALADGPLLACACLSNFFLSLRTVFAKRLLKVGMSPRAVFEQISLVATAVLVPLAVAELAFSRLDRSAYPALLYCCISGFCYWGYNFVGFMLLKQVSSSTYAVGKELRCLVVYVWLILQKAGGAFSLQSAAGIVCVLIGSFFYGRSISAPKAPLSSPRPLDGIV
ncbi:hypothetical protein DIPPA_01462 [Diplonema papillatum]|nr:hypothetical protein DIPPA_01462 [Diplonema papillatum]